ncbi:hypothetical protein NM208_g4444 [Fusarium decemcellulare]|uniref:Uncharacterized protein n=1 Tax=Fusarium decemcellulare TaxID=57161 RepID=A0ACC1SKT2_9HYPO|nr:hypothetical protein NM208_g4444 [Fusarium decemcellulare]
MFRQLLLLSGLGAAICQPIQDDGLVAHVNDTKVSYPGQYLKPRVLVLTDISPATHEPDDMESMVHLLASADLFEIEGLIATTGWSIDYPDPLHPGLISDVIDRYRSDLPKLMKRSEQQAFEDDEVQQQIGYWPSPEYLENVIRVGLPGRGMRWVGDNNATNGSDWIIRTVDEEDDRPVWITIWGGGNTLAQAIWDVKRTRSQEELDIFLSKIRVYAITDQDNDGWDDMQSSAQLWIRKTFPDLFYISSEWGWIIYGTTIQSQYWNSTYTSQIQGKGALGKHYPTYRYTVEGDTPSWLYLWPGMNDPEDPSQSSFGGCFGRTLTRDNVTKPYTDYESEARDCTNATIQRIMPDQVNDFVSRLDWAAEGTGNRNPRVVLEGDHGYAPVIVSGKPSSVVFLDAKGTHDPDRDSLSYEWYQDCGATGCGAKVSISGQGKKRVGVTIPKDAKGKEIHIILRVTDDGAPALSSYRRAIIKAGGYSEL